MIDMSAEAVSRRLRQMAVASANPTSRGARGVPMDAGSVTARLRSLAELSELCRRLGHARPVAVDTAST